MFSRPRKVGKRQNLRRFGGWRNAEEINRLADRAQRVAAVPWLAGGEGPKRFGRRQIDSLGREQRPADRAVNVVGVNVGEGKIKL